MRCRAEYRWVLSFSGVKATFIQVLNLTSLVGFFLHSSLVKMTNSNAKLYFYGGEALLKALKNGYLPLSDDWGFLTPYFDFSEWDVGRVTSISEREFQAELEVEYGRLPDGIRAMLSFDDFLSKKEDLRASITARVLSQRSPNRSGYVAERLNKVWNLRLFDSAVSAFAWRYLADEHRGVCVSVDSQSAIFNSGSSLPALVRPVTYGEVHDVSLHPDNPLPGALNDCEENRTHGEWRALFPKVSFEQPKLKLAVGQVSGVYIGAAASDTLRKSLESLVKLDLRYRRTELFEVLPDASRWRLTSRSVET